MRLKVSSKSQRTNLWIPKGKGEDGRNWELGTDIYTLSILCIKQLMRTYVQHRGLSLTLCGVLKGEDVQKGRDMWIYVHFAKQEKFTQQCKAAIRQ